MSFGRFDESRDAEGNRDFIQVTRPRPGTTVISMNRPERMNSMAFEQVIPLHAALDEVAHDNATGVVILTGSGKGFCSGADTQGGAPPPNIEGLTAPELGLSFLLPRAIGSSRAFELMLSGRDIGPVEAAEIGLVSRWVPDARLLDEALDLADQINGWSRNGTQLTKRIMWAGLESGSLANAIELESRTQLYARLTTQNFEEAIRARKEKRPPEFKD